MKIKSVVQICKKSETIELVNVGHGRQWLGDGAAFYPLFDMPIFTEETFAATFDLSERDRNNVRSTMQEVSPLKSVCLDEATSEECEVEVGPINVRYKGNTYIPLYGSHGVNFINEIYLVPFSDREDLFFFERGTQIGENTYFVIKKGFMVCGVVCPVSLPNKEFMEALTDLYQQCFYKYDQLNSDISVNESQ